MKKVFSLLLITILMVSFATPVFATEGEPINYITNGNFEMGEGGQWGEIPGWTPSIPVGSMDLYIGNYYYDVGRNSFPSDTYIALRKETNPAGDEVSVTQTITNLPVGIYEFSVWLWAATNTEYFTVTLESADDYVEIEAIPGVRDYDYAEIAVKDGNLTITIAADNVDKNRFMDALADDLKLVQIQGAEAFATPTPTLTPTEEPSTTTAPSTTDDPVITEDPSSTSSSGTDASATKAADETAGVNEPKAGNENNPVWLITLCIALVIVGAVVAIILIKKMKK